ncbi:DUF3618 domain-containing protein [Azospirillum thermophilum]|uniref:DUF3618 domain-containing protein n=1 Tax=Azospirillum thermophilum TaxID=2202148 RepID=A0A2S2CWR0_9PROT|nr:DUF3618 domain-containing protein [Azospirillum thermophilum]AWK88964.1 hypothetical protein DEW08_23300 [Azospirillum thermophilum]
MSSSTDTSHDPSAAAGSARGRRRPEDIEQDIRAIRSRMDHVLDEIEYRLSPGQLSGGAIEVARDVVQGNPTRIARAIRGNPLPVALIGIGALWLAWAISRTPPLVTGAPPEALQDPVSPQRARILLVGLAGACRQGAERFRQADLRLADTDLSPRLSQVATQLERSALALEEELYRLGGQTEPDAPVHPVWHDFAREPEGGRSRTLTLAGLESGLDGTLQQFREVLHEPLPEDLRVVVGTHFHDIEMVRYRVGALREALA